MEHRPAVLLTHDGELSELAHVLTGLGVELHERVGAPNESESAWSWDLVVGTPRRLIELDAGSGSAIDRIAVLDGDTRTARALVARAGIRRVVRLPVHPAALRLLVLHSLYRGPERRRTPRVGIGAAIRFRSGLRRRTAILVDLSRRGCRLLTTDAVAEGRRLSLALPAEIAGGRPLSLMGVAGRVLDTDPRMPGVQSMVIHFESTSARDLRRLDEIVAAHASSPAVCPADSGAPFTDPSAWPTGSAANADGAVPELELDEPTDDRRTSPRRGFTDPVFALGDEAARVLLGRDLSAGGMRVDPHPDLRIGDEVRLALHLGVCPESLLVRARVERDDGEDGLVLVFHEHAPEERAGLERALSLLPVVEMPDSGEETSGLVVSEIVSHQPSSANPS
ncbi:MAG: PilZ domain-containing protein [Myxococcales bacterium]|nr:MAG: PilZ domain-containing protein [Myxococcales bacterium]